MKSVLDQAQAAVVYALQLAALAVLEVLVASCVCMGATSTALLWQLVLGAWRAMRWAEVCRCVLVAAAAAALVVLAAAGAAAACRCAVVAAIWPMAAMWLSHRRTRRDAAAVAEACRSCRAHRPLAAAAVCLYAVVPATAAVVPVLAAMCACMSVLAAAVRAAICA